jgi:hypothetical protein
MAAADDAGEVEQHDDGDDEDHGDRHGDCRAAATSVRGRVVLREAWHRDSVWVGGMGARRFLSFS